MANDAVKVDGESIARLFVRLRRMEGTSKRAIYLLMERTGLRRARVYELLRDAGAFKVYGRARSVLQRGKGWLVNRQGFMRDGTVWSPSAPRSSLSRRMVA